MRVDSNSQDKHSHIEFSPSQALYVYIISISTHYSSRQKYQHAPKILGLALMLVFYYHL